MKKKEIREVTVTYCDWCGKEIDPPYSTLELKNGRKVDLCSDYKEGEKTCFEKYTNALKLPDYDISTDFESWAHPIELDHHNHPYR